MSARDRVITAIAERQHSVFSVAQARACGFSYAVIHDRVASGVWIRIHIGVYRIAGSSLTHRARVMAATLAAGESVASHRTAAALHGLDGFATDRTIEVMIFDRRGLEIPEVILHRPRVWLEDDRSQRDGIPVTSVCRTLFDLAAVMRGRRVQVAFDDALRQGATTLDALERRLGFVNKRGVRGVQQIGLLIADRSHKGVTDSELETKFRRLLEDATLPLPVPQYEIRREDGSFVARVDFAYPGARIAIELDSWKHHGGRSAFESDRIRQNELVAARWTPLRFTDRDLRSRRSWVGAIVQRHLLDALAVLGPTSSAPA